MASIFTMCNSVNVDPLSEGPTIDSLSASDQGHVCGSAPVSNHEETRFAYKGNGPWFACLPSDEIEPRLANSGVAGKATEPTTLPRQLLKAAAQKPTKKIFSVERPVPAVVDKQVPPPLPIEQWTTWTFESALNDIKKAAKACISLGMARFESVNIWGFNAPEWHMSAYAAMFTGGKCAGLYPTDTPDTAAFKVVHSQGRVVVVEDKSKVERLVKALNARGDCKKLFAIVTYGYKPEPNESVQITGPGKVPVMSWDDFLCIGESVGSDDVLNERIANTKPGHCAALIYTSGTTGEPKAVMISHDSINFEVLCIMYMLKKSVGFACLPEAERVLSYLPLSHVAGFLLDIILPVDLAATTDSWGEVYFARPYDLKERAIKDRLGVAKPTMFIGVPLVWEKIADQIRSLGAQGSWTQQQISGWAKARGLEQANSTQLGGDGSVPWGFSIAKSLVHSKVKGSLGLDKCKFAFTGAAPIRKDTQEFFGSLGLNINEVYGMSECTGACTWSLDQAHVWGSCGFEMPGIEVKAFKVNEQDLNDMVECPRAPSLEVTSEEYQGELCFRGRNIMMGYMACPDLGQAHIEEIKKKTAEAIDANGWLHSGDKGLVSNKGMVKITGRYKELIIGEGGENIAPVPIEDQIKKACDGICEVMLIGDKRKYNVALITLKAVGANGEMAGTDQLDAGAKRVNPAVQTISAALDDKVWIDAVTAAVNAANQNGQCCPNNAFKVQKFCILPTNFSEEGAELTPTKKLKRKIVETKYASLIDKIYNTSGVYIRYSE